LCRSSEMPIFREAGVLRIHRRRGSGIPVTGVAGTIGDPMTRISALCTDSITMLVEGVANVALEEGVPVVSPGAIRISSRMGRLIPALWGVTSTRRMAVPILWVGIPRIHGSIQSL
jgi:hypothetical protein